MDHKNLPETLTGTVPERKYSVRNGESPRTNNTVQKHSNQQRCSRFFFFGEGERRTGGETRSMTSTTTKSPDATTCARRHHASRETEIPHHFVHRGRVYSNVARWSAVQQRHCANDFAAVHARCPSHRRERAALTRPRRIGNWLRDFAFAKTCTKETASPGKRPPTRRQFHQPCSSSLAGELRVCDGLPPAGVLKGSSVANGRLAAYFAISAVIGPWLGQH